MRLQNLLQPALILAALWAWAQPPSLETHAQALGASLQKNHQVIDYQLRVDSFRFEQMIRTRRQEQPVLERLRALHETCETRRQALRQLADQQPTPCDFLPIARQALPDSSDLDALDCRETPIKLMLALAINSLYAYQHRASAQIIGEVRHEPLYERPCEVMINPLVGKIWLGDSPQYELCAGKYADDYKPLEISVNGQKIPSHGQRATYRIRPKTAGKHAYTVKIRAQHLFTPRIDSAERTFYFEVRDTL